MGKFGTSFLALAALIAGKDLFAFDAVSCQWELPSYRQLCKIDSQDRSVSFSVPARESFLGYGFSNAVLKTQEVRITKSGTTSAISLAGLQPILEMDSDFKNLAECKVSGVWKDRIALFLRLPDGSDRQVDDVAVGAGVHSVSFNSNPEKPEGVISLSADTVSMSATFLFKNLDDTPRRPPAVQRIPPQCKLNIDNVRLTFDSVSVNRDLQSLGTTLSLTTKSLMKETVLHGLYVKEAVGAACTVEKLAKTLYGVEGLAEGEDPSNLSLLSQRAIGEAVQLAQGVGGIAVSAIPVDGAGNLDYFAYYKVPANRETLKTSCATILENLKVNKDLFVKDGKVVNAAAYQNAIDYDEDKQNLRAIIDGAWALATVAKKDVENAAELNWLIDPKVYGFALEQ